MRKFLERRFMKRVSMFELTMMMMRNKLQVHIRNPSVIEEQFLLSGKDTMIIVVI
jgi:hypothetical protein